MKRKVREQFVHSKPTMCLGCHLIVRMFHEGDADPLRGAWQCPSCGRRYPFLHWKIRKDLAKTSQAA